jgi:hypothetical protein
MKNSTTNIKVGSSKMFWAITRLFQLSRKHTGTLLLLTFFIFIGTMIQSTASYAKLADKMGIDEQAKSWVYYNSMSMCINQYSIDLGNRGLFGWFGSAQDASNQANVGKWFEPNALGPDEPTIGYFLSGAKSGLKTDGDHVNCSGDNINWILDAIKLWGYNDGLDAICEFGASRTNGSDCRDGSGEISGKNGGQYLSLDLFKASVKRKIGKEPALSDAARYILYRDSFFTGCIGSTKPATSDPNDSYTYIIPLADTLGSAPVLTKYEGIKKHDERINFYVNEKPANVSDTCKNIADVINTLALKYVQQVLDNNDKGIKEKEIAENKDTGATTSCNIDGVGWLVCPVINFMAGIADGAFGFLADNFLSTSPTIFTGLANDTNPTLDAWSAMRNIANVMFVIAFLIIIFSQITSFGISNYGIKKMLPRLIIAAILVNVSFYICQIAVDLSNILGFSLKSFLAGLVPSSVNTTGSSQGNWVGIVGTVLAAGAIAWASLAVLIPAILAAIVALIMILFILIARQALIILLIVLSPLAFVAFLLPNTNDWFKKWQKAFTAMLMLFPIIALVFGASTLASNILSNVFDAANSSTNPMFGKIVAAVILVIPLFIVPGLLKKSLDGVGSIGTKLNGLGAKWGSSAGKAGSKAYDNSRLAQYKGFRANKGALRRNMIQSGTYSGRGGKANPRNWASGVNKKINENSGEFGQQSLTRGYALADEQYAKDMKNAGSRMDNMQFNGLPLSSAQTKQIALGKNVTHDGTDNGTVLANASSFDKYMQRDAIQKMGKLGTVADWHELIDESSKMDAGARKTLSATLAGSSMMTKTPYMGGKTLGDIVQGTTSSDQAALGSMSKINAEILASSDPEAIKKLVSVASTNSEAREKLVAAYAQYNDPSSARLKEKATYALSTELEKISKLAGSNTGNPADNLHI